MIKGFKTTNAIGLLDSQLYKLYSNDQKHFIDSYLNNFFVLNSTSVSLNDLKVELDYIQKEDKTPRIFYDPGIGTYPVVKVKNIHEKSPLFQTGIRNGDAILNINGTDLYHASIFDSALYSNFQNHIPLFLKPNQQNKITFLEIQIIKQYLYMSMKILKKTIA